MPMSGRICGSSLSKPMRTRTVALVRSAVGTMLITCAAQRRVRIGIERGFDALIALTRLMYASLTSTSTSRESMSTMVAMPVRVKPPPADIGEIISPGCASLEMTTPANGARTLRSL